MTTSDHTDFFDAVLSHFDGAAAEDAAAHIAEYFDPSTPYTGSQFELIADDSHPNEITARDLVAVSMLGVNIPAAVSAWVLSKEGASEIRSLLCQVPVDVDLWDRPDLLLPNEPLWTLWNLVSRCSWPRPDPSNGMGPTKKSKLLAAKRPRLVPVTDSVVVAALPKVPNYWEAFSELLADNDRLSAISSATATATAPRHLSMLRRIDITLWMAHRHHSHTPAQ